MARAFNVIKPVYIQHDDLPSELNIRDLPLIICEAVNNLVQGNTACAQKHDGVWSIWLKSVQARDYLLREAKVIRIHRNSIELFDEYPIIQTKFPSEKVMFRNLPFDVDDRDLLDYLYSQPDIQIKTRNVIHARIRNQNRELTSYYSGDRFVYVRGGMKRALPPIADIGHYQCKITHTTQETACSRCRYTGHNSNDTAACDAYREDNNVHTIRSPQNPLCNFYPCNITINDINFSSSEQVYQWKFMKHIGRDDLADEILHTTSPAQAKEIASRIPRHMHGTWHTSKLDIMNEILDAKVSCCPEFKNALLQSAGTELVEAVRSDRFWSCGLTPRDASTTKSRYYPGKNHLGRMLEYIRDSLSAATDNITKHDHDNSIPVVHVPCVDSNPHSSQQDDNELNATEQSSTSSADLEHSPPASHAETVPPSDQNAPTAPSSSSSLPDATVVAPPPSSADTSAQPSSTTLPEKEPEPETLFHNEQQSKRTDTKSNCIAQKKKTLATRFIRERTFSDSNVSNYKSSEIPSTMMLWLKRKRSPAKEADPANTLKQQRTETGTS